ncbi:MAG: 5-(carboxyamino)imidazole ribonucleotide mutase [Candidatus Buchananbacteria bacterium CG10_big_fil_rev_8_21_14_0_10_42_9]|uniref:5-(Carboxyamino)imidazole ribonucleotide mutase n=1 Tax=Candidatus Buchananbacteria bacterium CG10_big_fil_rev_8_21_14_0_10_42_9 TaxID=1974526 RepID=A0A2H0W179_9BACT|nr:MAG: 5-(carboxyamino)imidazole ribonucleotide mutase [Candidatus Buchananbacteria bacterium CG10_big_fil_rev_8_21_14_0_10_42_9]
MKVIILMGSDSDRPWCDTIEAALKEWDIPAEQVVGSAHKVPEKVLDLINQTNQEDDIVFVTVAGRSNALSGVVAANSVHPVLACPPFKDKSDLLVNIHSTMQMPSETPVLTVLDPNNVAGSAARIFGVSDKNVKQKVKDRIKSIKDKF